MPTVDLMQGHRMQMEMQESAKKYLKVQNLNLFYHSRPKNYQFCSCF